MHTARRQFLVAALKVLNLGLTLLAFGLSTALLVSEAKEPTSLAAFLSMRVKLTNFILFGGILFGWHTIFSLCGLYQSKRLEIRRSLIVGAAKATFLATILLAVAKQVFTIRMITVPFLLLFLFFSFLFVAGGRVLIRYLMERIRLRGHNLRNVLVLGTNRRAVGFARRLEARPELGYRVLGFVDEDWPGQQEFFNTQYRLCCDFGGLSGYLRRNVVDEVAIYLPLRSFHEHASQVAALCEQHGMVMRFDADLFDLKIAHPRTDDLDGYAHISAYSSTLDGWPILLKRVFDVGVSCALLIILAPLMATVALLIAFTSDGPILFHQERVGLNKRRFLIHKFRTMVPNAEKMQQELEMLNEVAGPVFKIKDDPRMTPIGKLLRRTSIDELPQLLNVLKGDMSLVGPRPLPVRDYEGFNEDWQRRRFSIRPGITCLWQVNGRSSISFEKWMQLDLQYMDEWSLWLDLKILALTVPAVLKGSGAA